MTHTLQAISPLHQRMIDDMRMRRLAPKTQPAHLRVVRQFTVFFGHAPDTATVEDLRRFLLHVLPDGLHRIRHYGLPANPVRRQNLARIRALLHAPAITDARGGASVETLAQTFVCRHCGARMTIIDILPRSHPIRAPPTSRGNA